MRSSVTDDRPRADFGTRLREIGMVVDLLRLSATEAIDDIAPLLHPEMRVLAAPGIAPARRYQTREARARRCTGGARIHSGNVPVDAWAADWHREGASARRSTAEQRWTGRPDGRAS